MTEWDQAFAAIDDLIEKLEQGLAEQDWDRLAVPEVSVPDHLPERLEQIAATRDHIDDVCVRIQQALDETANRLAKQRQHRRALRTYLGT